jgi:hypothetical protein
VRRCVPAAKVALELRSRGRTGASAPTFGLASLRRTREAAVATRALPLRGRLPLELALDFGFLFPMYGGAEGAFIDGIAARRKRLGHAGGGARAT